MLKWGKAKRGNSIFGSLKLLFHQLMMPLTASRRTLKGSEQNALMLSITELTVLPRPGNEAFIQLSIPSPAMRRAPKGSEKNACMPVMTMPIVSPRPGNIVFIQPRIPSPAILKAANGSVKSRLSQLVKAANPAMSGCTRFASIHPHPKVAEFLTRIPQIYESRYKTSNGGYN